MRILILIILFLIPRIGFALSVTPARMEVSQKAGEEKVYYFTIRNARPEPTLIKISVHDFDIDINGKVLITERKTSPSWVRMPIKQVRISFKGSKTVPFTIMLSTGSTGEKRAMFYFQEIVEKKGTVGIVMRMGSAVYCAVEGTEEINGEIKDFMIFPSKVMITFCNNGNVHLRPKIILIIKNSREEIIREISLTKDFPVLPFHKYNIEKKFENELEVGNYTATLKIRYKEIFERQEVPFGIFKIK